MPHEEEHISVEGVRPKYVGYYAHSSKRVPPVTGCSASSWSYAGTGYGSASKYIAGRAASTSSPKQPSGWRAPNPYWGYRWDEVVSAGGRLPSLNGGYPTRNNGPSLYGNDQCESVGMTCPDRAWFQTYRPNFSDLESKAITEALSELGESTAELGVELVEARKTASFLTSKLTSLVDNINDVRRRKIPRAWRKAKRVSKGSAISWGAKSLPERWMEYRYAWTPLVLGIYDMVDLLDNQTRLPLLTTTRKREVRSSSSSSSVDTFHGGYYPWPIVLKTENISEDIVYVVITTTPKRLFWQSLNDAGVVNPASVMWESIPFSWMADWFVNIGDYLSAQFAIFNTSLKGGTATHIYKRQKKQTRILRDQSNDVVCNPPIFRPGGLTAGGVSFNRRVLSSIDMQARLGFQQDPLNLTRALDLVSLAAGGLRKRNPGLRI